MANSLNNAETQDWDNLIFFVSNFFKGAFFPPVVNFIAVFRIANQLNVSVVSKSFDGLLFSESESENAFD